MDAQILKRHSPRKNHAPQPLTFGFAAIADFTSSTGQAYLAGSMQAAKDYGVNVIIMATNAARSFLAEPAVLPHFLATVPFMRPPLLDGLITWKASLREYMTDAEIQALFASLAPLPMADVDSVDAQTQFTRGYQAVARLIDQRAQKSHAPHARTKSEQENASQQLAAALSALFPEASAQWQQALCSDILAEIYDTNVPPPRDLRYGLGRSMRCKTFPAQR